MCILFSNDKAKERVILTMAEYRITSPLEIVRMSGNFGVRKYKSSASLICDTSMLSRPERLDYQFKKLLGDNHSEAVDVYISSTYAYIATNRRTEGRLSPHLLPAAGRALTSHSNFDGPFDFKRLGWGGGGGVDHNLGAWA
jgi:hypothetical protein